MHRINSRLQPLSTSKLVLACCCNSAKRCKATARNFLVAFDFSRMKQGTLFKQQIDSFFTQTESIRVHLNLVGTSLDGDKANLAVDAEMEAEPSNGEAPSRRNERLNFIVARVGDGWKFVDVQPRSFFQLP